MARKPREFKVFDNSAEEKSTNMDYLEDAEQSEVNKQKPLPKRSYVKHTFILYPEDLKALRKIVHITKSAGRYTYTQKEALHEAIQLLIKNK